MSIVQTEGQSVTLTSASPMILFRESVTDSQSRRSVLVYKARLARVSIDLVRLNNSKQIK